MLFHCVICLPCCGEKQTFSDSGMTDDLSWLTQYLHMPLYFSTVPMTQFSYYNICVIMSLNLANIQCIRHLIIRQDILCSQHVLID